MRTEETNDGRPTAETEPFRPAPEQEYGEASAVNGAAPDGPVAGEDSPAAPASAPTPPNPAQPTIIIQQPAARPTNGMGTAGFVLALLALVFSWVPVAGWILWLLGLIFSCIGVTRQPKGLAIAGLVISCAALVLLVILLLGVLGVLFATRLS